MITIEEIQRKITPLCEKNDVAFAGIFGSYAKNIANEKSDIDVLVAFKKPKSLIGLTNFEDILSDALKNKVDLVTEGSLSPYIKQGILTDMLLIYGKR